MIKKQLFLSIFLLSISFGAVAQFVRSADPKAEEDAKIVVKDKNGNVVKMASDIEVDSGANNASENTSDSEETASTDEKKELSKDEKKALKKELKARKKELKERRKKRPKFDSFEEELLYDINPEEFKKKNNPQASDYVDDGFKRLYLPYLYNPRKAKDNNNSGKLTKDEKEEFKIYAYRTHPRVDSNRAGIILPTYGKKNLDDLRFDKAKRLMQCGFFSSALPLLQEIYRNDPKNPHINKWIGICYYNAYSDQCKSIPYLRVAANNILSDFKYYEADDIAENNFDPIMLLAQAYHGCGDIQEAEGIYRSYLEVIKEESKLSEERELTQLYLRQIAQAERIKNTSRERFTIKNLSDINGYYAEVAARPVGNNTIIFARASEPDIYATAVNFVEGGRFYTDIFRAERNGYGWNKPEKLNVSSAIDDIPVSVSDDQSKIFYHSYSADSSNLYVAQKNFDAYDEGYTIFRAPPFLDFKGTFTLTGDGKTLIFSAAEEDGFGGFDLYISTLNDDGSWKDPVNLGETVNSPRNEVTPYIHPNGKTLYFSKDGPESMGGYDIFKTEINGFNQWEKPINLGLSVNTTTNDIFYSISADGHYGYFSRLGENGDYDIFEINYFSTSTEISNSLNTDALNKANPADVILTNLVTRKAKKYSVDPSTGTYNLVLEPCVNYRLEYLYSGNKRKQETFMTPCNTEVGETFEFNPFEDLGSIQVLLNESGKGNYNNPKTKLPNAWQVLVDGKPYRFENYVVRLKDNLGTDFYSTKIDKMGNFRLPDLNYQEPTFVVQVLDIDICDRLSIVNISGKNQELRYPECFEK